MVGPTKRKPRFFSARDMALDRAAPGNTAPLTVLLPELRTHGVRGVSPNGVLGDPTGASAAEGAELFDTLVERALTAFDRLPG